ncbi:hypothetical protein [Acidovorax sp. RAC01]|uniref:hypothetical protein n=1 Tax=Acidovorax sp. RAC01 TaxID=1842533 RepID=UPI00083E7217|nr:hypothetical protein [Acidovorax sp. RAC01]AOG24196.1 putative membrane protein [Acidovorax sp. RAC01]
MATQQRPSSTPAAARGKPSSWRAVRMPQLHPHDVAQTLQQRHSLRWHGLLIGSFTLLMMWLTSHVQMRMGVESLALRYLVTLSVGYVAYLLVVRTWAARLVRDEDSGGLEGGSDAAELAADVADMAWSRGGGNTGTVPVRVPRLPEVQPGIDAGSSSGVLDGLGDMASGAADAIGGADDGAVIVVPIVAIFLIGSALILGAGSLAMLFFGWDVLLAVAVEVAFSVVAARAAVGVEREGWLSAAVRLTWKPLLGALLCAVVLGATIDHFLPGVQSLPEAVRAIQGR